MNLLGICTWTLGIDEPEAMISKARELGLDGIQFCGTPSQYDAHELRALAHAQGMQIFAIDPFDCAPEDPTQATAEGAIAFYRQAIDFARDAGAPWVTLQGLSAWTQNCENENAAWERLVSCIRTLETYATSQDIRLVYEVVNRYEVPMIRTFDECMRLLSDVGSSRIGILLDSFHMNIDETDPCAVIRRCGSRLASYHISDSNRGGIGSGHIDYLAQHRALQDIGFDGPVMVEIVLPHLTPTTTPRNSEERSRLDEEIRRSVRIWRAMNGKH